MFFKNFKEKFEKKPVMEFTNKVTSEPLVSICVQAYQHKKYIKKCLDGILIQQTDFPVEILLGEDESTDGTREICLEYAQKYPNKIRLLLHRRENNIKINGELSGRFNFLYNLFSARGEFIALCDGDDYWTDPFKLQKQVELLQSNTLCELCFTSSFQKSPNGTIKERNLEGILSFSNFDDLLKRNFIVSSTVLFRNYIRDNGLPGWITKTFVGDWPLFLWILKKEGKIALLNFPGVVYRTDIGVSKHFKINQIKILHSMLELKTFLLKDPNFFHKKSIIQKSVLTIQLQLMSYFNKNRNYLTSMSWFLKSIKLKNWFTVLKLFCYSLKVGIKNPRG